MFTLLFVSLFVAGWLLCAYVPWLALAIVTRGQAGMKYLPLCLFAGVVAGLAVPVLGLDDGRGLALSFVAAFAVPSVLLAARRLSLANATQTARAPHSESGDLPG